MGCNLLLAALVLSLGDELSPPSLAIRSRVAAAVVLHRPGGFTLARPSPIDIVVKWPVVELPPPAPLESRCRRVSRSNRSGNPPDRESGPASSHPDSYG